MKKMAKLMLLAQKNSRWIWTLSFLVLFFALVIKPSWASAEDHPEVFTISGAITEHDGTAVPGVSVQANPFCDDNGICDGLTSSTQTDVNGSYTLFVVPGTYRVGVYDSSHPYGFYHDSGISKDENDATLVQVSNVALTGKNIQYPEIFTISGAITEHDSSAISGMRVYAAPCDENDSCDGLTNWAETDANGNYTLYTTKGNYQIGVDGNSTHPGGYYRDSGITDDWDNASVVTVNNGNLTEKNLQYPKILTISGAIIDHDGTPISGKSVYAEKVCDENGNCEGLSDWWETDASGNYTIYATAGNYLIYVYGDATHVGGYYNDSGILKDRDNATIVTLSNATLDGINIQYSKKFTISGTITDHDGGAVEGVYVYAQTVCDANGNCDGLSASAHTDANGNYTIDTTAGSYRIYVYGNGTFESGYYNDSGIIKDLNNATVVTVSVANLTGKNIRYPELLTISGTITGNNGIGISGMYVYAETVCDANGNCDGWSTEAQTDANGNYTITATAGNYRIYVDGDSTHPWGYYSDSGITQDWDNATTLTLSDTSLSGKDIQYVSISGTITDHNGVAIEGKYVYAQTVCDANGNCDGGSNGMVQTDANGTYSITTTAGNYRIYVYGNAIFESGYYNDSGIIKDLNNATVVTVSDTNLTGKNIRYPELLTISGTITGNNGTGISGMYVYAETVCDANGNCDGWSTEAQTDANGNYTITATAGNYRIYVDGDSTHPWGYYSDSGITQDWDNATTLTLSDTSLSGKDIQYVSISGIITDHNGAAISGMYVYAETVCDANGNCDGGSNGRVQTDATGNYTIYATVGNYRIHVYGNASHPGGYYNDDGITYDRNSATTIVLSDTSLTEKDIQYTIFTISGTITDHNGAAVTGMYVYAETVCDDNGNCGGWSTEAQTDANGNYTIYVTAGGYQIYVYGDSTHPWGYYSDSGIISWDNATVVTVGNANLTGKNIQYGEIFTISGAIIDNNGTAVTGMSIYAERVCDGNGNCDGWSTGAQTDANGSYTVYATAGNYRIHAYGNATHPGGYYSDNGIAHAWNSATTLTLSGTSLTGKDIHYYTSISGTITDHNGAAIEGMYVYGEPVCDDNGNCDGWSSGAQTDANGNYTIYATAGNYWIYVDGDSTHPWGYYSDSGIISWDNPTVVTVGDTNLAGKNIQYGEILTISGTIIDNNGAAVTGMSVYAERVCDGNGNCDGWSTGAQTDSNGNYTVYTTAGNYRIHAYGNATHPGGYYSDNGIAHDWSSATTLTLGDTSLSGKNIQYAIFTISGTITGHNGTAIQGMYVYGEAACDDNGNCDGWSNWARTDANGNYTIYTTAGNYRIAVNGDNTHPQGYYHTNGFTTNQDSATLIPVDSASLTGKDIQFPGLVMISGALEDDLLLDDPQVVYWLDSVIVPEGITLTLKPGVVIKFSRPYSLLQVDGTLDAQGTVDTPIVITSSKDDTAGGDTNGDDADSVPSAGAWNGIHISSTGGASVLSHCEVRYGGIDINGSNPTIDACTVSQSDQLGIRLVNASPSITNCTIRNFIFNSDSDSGGDLPAPPSYGIYIEGTSNPTISGCNLAQNSYGIYATNPGITIKAENNAWGDLDGGPNDSSDDRAQGGLYNPDGSGVEVSDHVDYFPWIGASNGQLSAPTGLAATPGNGEINLSWSANNDPSLGGYKIYYGTTPGGYEIPLVVGAVTAWQVPNLENGTRYYFAISPLNSVGEDGPQSMEISATPLEDVPPPSSIILEPANGAFVSSPLPVTGTAGDGMGTGVQKVELSVNNGQWLTANGTDTWTYDVNLAGDGVYTIRSRATDFAGNVETPADAQTVTVYVDTTPPNTAITSGPVEGAYTSSTVTLSWSASDNLPGSLAYSYQLDSNSWSAFDPITSHTFDTLAEGQHTVSVKAKDQAGNVDATPAMRTFVVDTIPPAPATSFKASPSANGVRLDWTQSLSPDVDAYRVYWDNGTGVINYETPLATLASTSNSYLAAITHEGTYKFGLRATDMAGNEEQNSSVTDSQIVSWANITVNTGMATHDRGQDVPITGTVTTTTGNPIVNILVAIDVEANGYHREYTAYTNAVGEFGYIFQPLSSEAGTYNVTARLSYQGFEKSAATTFDVLGLLQQPASLAVAMSMNSTKTVDLSLRNIGPTPLTDIHYSLIDSNPNDFVTATLDTSTLPTVLNPAASTILPVVIQAPAGLPPAAPLTFVINTLTAEGAQESTTLTVTLHEAVSALEVTPNPLTVGVRLDEPATKVATVTNKGYASSGQAVLTVHDPVTYNWVTVLTSDLGVLAPSESKELQIYVNPSAGVAMGTYVVQLDLSDNGVVTPVYLTVEVSTTSVGQVEFKVYDDTGAVVQGAEVNLVSKEFYLNAIPQGQQEYNNVITATTDASGHVHFQDVPAGEYRYVINAVKHGQLTGEIVVESGSAPAQPLTVIMVTNLVSIDFKVTPTTIQDEYNVTLDITYVTDLIKPTLLPTPTRIGLSFFPEETQEGVLTIENTSNNAPVRNLVLDATGLDPSNNEVKFVFANGQSTITIPELGFQKSIQIPYKATIPNGGTAQLNTRNLGNIIATAEYTFSLEGDAYESTTTTPIPVIFSKPSDFSFPSISYKNDERDGDLNNLEYQGNTYRLKVQSNRDMGVTLDNSLGALTHVLGGPDNQSIIDSNQPFFWDGIYQQTRLLAKGESAAFDIDTLKGQLEDQLRNHREEFLGHPSYVSFLGQWDDRVPKKDAYLIPVSITTLRETQIFSTGGFGGWSGGSIPNLPSEYGEVKLQIDQKATLERQTFNAQLDMTPTVPNLDNVHMELKIQDSDGNDASANFFVLEAGKSGIGSLEGGTLSGPAEVKWQIIPNSSAGGTQAEGLAYTISAAIEYDYEGQSYSYTTKPQTVTILPMPKLTIDYSLPYVVMGGEPIKVKVKVSNQGFGVAHDLVIASAQPKIVENLNNIPISFILNGSSPSVNPADYKPDALTIDFGDVPPGATVEGYWLLTSSKDGYFVEFTSAFTHQDYRGVQLDPLIEAVNTHFVPAIGGHITQTGLCGDKALSVELWQAGALVGQAAVDQATDAYFISDLTPGDYTWFVKDPTGSVLSNGGNARNITVVDGQPTSQINGDANSNLIDTDHDGLPDCWENNYFGNLAQGPDGDYDHDGATNLEEYLRGTDPTVQNIPVTQASTVFGPEPKSGLIGDPVNTAIGNYTYSKKDITLPGKGLPFVFERGYNSQDGIDGPLGFGWTHSYNVQALTNGASAVTIRWGDGKTETWTPDGSGGYTPPPGVFDTLTATGDGTHTLQKKDMTRYLFDAAGRLTSITDKNGNTITLIYTVGYLTQVLDSAGRTIDLSYDNNNRISAITDPIGLTVQFNYDAEGNLVAAQDMNGNLTIYTYDSNHQMLTLVDPKGNTVVTNEYDNQYRVVSAQRDAKMGQTTYAYDQTTQETTIVDQMGFATVHLHDDLLRLIQETDALGNSSYFSYDAAGNRTQVKDKKGSVTQYAYDLKGNVLTKTDALGHVTTITYDPHNNPLTRIDALGNITTFQYDTNGNLIKTTDPMGKVMAITYTANGQPLTITDARGNTTASVYDAQGNLIEVTDAFGNKTSFTYDGVGRKLAVTDALGRTATSTYDHNNNLLTITDPMGNVTASTYDGNNNRLTVVDAKGNTTRSTYDAKDLLVTVTDPLGGQISNTYDALDRKTASTDRRGNTTTYAYDAVGNLLSTTDPLGNVTAATYDANGNRLTETNPLGKTATYTYDALNRAVAVVDPLGNTATKTYDAIGRTTLTTNPKGQTTTFTYDAMGRLLQVVDANGGVVAYTYDPNGNRLSTKEPGGNTTTYAYDALNRPSKRVEPLGGVYQYIYDAVGNKVSATDANGTTTTYAYDNNNRLTTISYPDASQISLSYDALGAKTQMTDSLGVTHYAYDALGRMTSTTDAFGKTIDYGYDANGNRTWMLYPDGKVVTNTFDALNRLNTVTDWQAMTTSYTYDAAGNLTGTVNPNGTTVAYSFDASGRLTGLSNAKSDASVIASYSYTIDAIGNQASVDRNEPLAPVLASKNLTYAHDADNRMTSAGSTANTFDANGNMTAKGTDAFTYDYRNQLTESTTVGTMAHYRYDGLGNRMVKQVGGVTTRYVVDSNGGLANVVAETDAAGSITAYYVYGLGLISKVRPDGAASYYHYDSRGSTIALTDQEQTVTDAYAYNAFGAVANHTGSTVNPFRYVGRYGLMDEGNGLTYVRARYYVPELGRFISKDLLLGQDGDGQSLNRYAYGLNNPVRLVDVSGYCAMRHDNYLKSVRMQKIYYDDYVAAQNAYIAEIDYWMAVAQATHDVASWTLTAASIFLGPVGKGAKALMTSGDTAILLYQQLNNKLTTWESLFETGKYVTDLLPFPGGGKSSEVLKAVTKEALGFSGRHPEIFDNRALRSGATLGLSEALNNPNDAFINGATLGLWGLYHN